MLVIVRLIIKDVVMDFIFWLYMIVYIIRIFFVRLIINVSLYMRIVGKKCLLLIVYGFLSEFKFLR